MAITSMAEHPDYQLEAFANARWYHGWSDGIDARVLSISENSDQAHLARSPRNHFGFWHRFGDREH